MQKNDIATVAIEDIGVNGEGIGKVNGYTLFIKDAVIGDIVEAKVKKAKKNYGYARLVNIITPSPSRVQPKCKYARKCGGCQIQELSYIRQLEFKNKKIKSNLEHIGGFEPNFLDKIMEPMVGMDTPFYYRNKAQFPFGTDKEGNPIVGFYAGRTHDIIANTDCAMGVSANKEILELILDFMKKYHISSYDEKTGKGLIRHALIRYGFKTKEIMVCLIINGKSVPHSEALIDNLKEIKGMTSITVSVNTDNTNVIMGNSYEVLWGQGYITDYIDQIKYQISPLSFYQVNPVQTEKLYRLAMEYAGLKGDETVWDLYCGIGSISLFIAQKAKQVYGVEVVPQAIEDAKNNARINGIDNAEFIVGKAEEVLPDYYRRYEEMHQGEKAHADVIIVDPPRKGCDETLLETMIEIQPDRIVYVSCDSATLARDLNRMSGAGYEVERVRGVDQFPMTVHVETVALLTRKKDVEGIDIEMTVGREDVTEKATYQKIKEYVKEKYGLNVHTKYIAEVKRKHGLPMHEAPNKADEPKREYPGCPEEKVKAIEEALKYFGIIK